MSYFCTVLILIRYRTLVFHAAGLVDNVGGETRQCKITLAFDKMLPFRSRSSGWNLWDYQSRDGCLNCSSRALGRRPKTPKERGRGEVHVGLIPNSRNSNCRRLKELILATVAPGESISDYDMLVTGHSLLEQLIWRLCLLRILENSALTPWTCPTAMQLPTLSWAMRQRQNKLRTDQQEAPTSPELAAGQLWKSSRRRQNFSCAASRERASLANSQPQGHFVARMSHHAHSLGLLGSLWIDCTCH
jgi:hypothetical protein